jgi:hypothetical protein
MMATVIIVIIITSIWANEIIVVFVVHMIQTALFLYFVCVCFVSCDNFVIGLWAVNT